MTYDMTHQQTFQDIKDFWFGEVIFLLHRSKNILKAFLKFTC